MQNGFEINENMKKALILVLFDYFINDKKLQHLEVSNDLDIYLDSPQVFQLVVSYEWSHISI